jgi:hypothetical protein
LTVEATNFGEDTSGAVIAIPISLFSNVRFKEIPGE